MIERADAQDSTRLPEARKVRRGIQSPPKRADKKSPADGGACQRLMH